MPTLDRKAPIVALVLSAVPGGGHLYAGAVGSGIAWLIGVVIAYRISPCFGLAAHFICASSAVEAVKRSNAAEGEEIKARRESASEVGGILDAVVRERGGPPGPTRASTTGSGASGEDPPPRMVTGGIAAPPEATARAVADAFTADGLEVRGIDRARGIVKAVARFDGAKVPVVARVEATPRGSRVRILIDRPAGTHRDDDVDDRLLHRLLEETGRRVGAGDLPPGTGIPDPVPDPVPDPAPTDLSEDDFFDELQEAWEAREQGWMPEEEWLARRAELVRDVMLRPETRQSDFIHACRPLVEADILTPDDLRAMENAMRGR